MAPALGYFFDSGPLGVPKVVPEDVFGHTDLLGRIFDARPKIEFFSNGGEGYWRFGQK